ncbi:hypothetical protein A7H1H_1096 [Aliarcobacter butzleri 7h1h]|uniref:hypothetical protein n=1 Tax=Aliarcobacter butzleri TaxID=28197 RepID=UPI00035B9DFB|nr:hypothetical protein [Aliarcobacter butzleri]AGR77396.1 hypothetical protein A7H1H_1096 [Aliarcobacter butzleri 7h1h]
MKKKKFIFYILIFTVILLLLRKGTINSLNQYFFEQSFFYDRGHWVKQDDLHPKIVFLGSSLTRHTIIPKIVAKNSNLKESDIANLGMNAATPYEMYLTFKKNIANFKNVQIVFYNLDPWILSKKYYVHKKYEKTLWTFEEWEKYSNNKGLQNYLNYETTLFKESINQRNYNRAIFKDYGYEPLECKEEYKEETKEGVETFFKDIINDKNYAISFFQLEYLKKLKNLVEKNNSKFIILYIPNQESYTKNINEFNSNYNKVLENNLNKYLGDTIQYGTFCPNNISLENKSDFFDKSHLCENGAKKYSNYLGNIFDKDIEFKATKININYNCL